MTPKAAITLGKERLIVGDSWQMVNYHLQKAGFAPVSRITIWRWATDPKVIADQEEWRKNRINLGGFQIKEKRLDYLERLALSHWERMYLTQDSEDVPFSGHTDFVVKHSDSFLKIVQEISRLMGEKVPASISDIDLPGSSPQLTGSPKENLALIFDRIGKPEVAKRVRQIAAQEKAIE